MKRKRNKIESMLPLKSFGYAKKHAKNQVRTCAENEQFNIIVRKLF